MYSALDTLTAIQPHSGWRGSATPGEAEGLDYLQQELESLEWLTAQGMTQERESFNVFFGTVDHASSLILSDGERTAEIPADAIRGNRDDPVSAMRMDSDGIFDGPAEDPIHVEGPVVPVPDAAAVDALKGSDLTGNVLLADYSLTNPNDDLSLIYTRKLLEMNPAALVFVTSFSNTVGEPSGNFIGDGGGVIQRLGAGETVPLLFIEMENLSLLGIEDWDGISNLTSAQVKWDTDVLNPAQSGNLLVHIPGNRKDTPILLSAHIDSANTPGALDDGSGTVILLEIANILNELQVKPENDLFLAWYGSEELGLYGSTYFTTTHSDLLNRLTANIQLDCLTHPLDGLPAEITLMFSHIKSNSLTSDPLGRFLINQGNELSMDLDLTYWPFASDNGSLSAFDIPNVNIIYESSEMDNSPGGVWAAGHLHDPYDTADLAREMESVLVEMTSLSLSAVFTPLEADQFRVPEPDKKAVFLANHTESPHMTPAGLPEFSLELIRAGYQISVIPYGKTLAAEDLAGADLVVVLPVLDYPITEIASDTYDAAWTAEEAVLINDYAKKGGRVMIVNSANRLKFYSRVLDENEDWEDLNTITNQWGVKFVGIGADSYTLTTDTSSLMHDVPEILITPANAVYFSITDGEALAGMKSKAYLAQIKVGNGEVLIISDMTMLGEYDQGLMNPQLVRNLANWK